MKSIFLGRDHELLKQMLDFYVRPDGPSIDVTCNSRRFWKNNTISNLICLDIDSLVFPDIVSDYNFLPFRSGSVSLIVFDPPHLPSAAGTEASLQPFVQRYGLKNTIDGDNISSVFPRALCEFNRVLCSDGLIFVKLADYVHNHKYQWILVDFINSVKAVPGLTPTDLIVKADPAAGNLKSGKWKRSHHARRGHCWWIVVRKGKCEPSHYLSAG